MFRIPVRDIQNHGANGGERPYRDQAAKLNGNVYSNRRYTWSALPATLIDATTIQPRNSDADVGSRGGKFLSFTVDEPCEIWVAHDRRIGSKGKPEWLRAFAKTPLQASSEDATYDLYRKTASSGRVQLGGNTIDGSPAARSQYVVFVTPLPLGSAGLRGKAASVSDVLDVLGQADVQRGGRIFFRQAECWRCHQVGGLGNAYAPNLTNLGKRASPTAIAESILEPSKVITEGFHTLLLQTKDGRRHSGFLKQESGRNLELVSEQGELLVIPKHRIERRTRQATSLMPSGYAKQLSPKQVADLIAYIRHVANQPGSSNHPPPSDSEKKKRVKTAPSRMAAVTFTDDGRQLKVFSGDHRIATYVYRHDKVKRPFFANVQSPAGAPVTRHFPPRRGRDAVDHADMHPGIWLAFGDINGVDFWRNKGVVEHHRFAEKPAGQAGRGAFRETKIYRTADGQVVGHEQFRWSIKLTEQGHLYEFQSEFKPSQGASMVFGDQEEMGLGVRVATGITEKDGGMLTDANNRQSANAIWSQSTRWCNYQGKVDGQSAGAAIFCGAENFRPSWMHARNYGLVVANAFGRAAMKKGAPSRHVVTADKPLRLKYAVLVHDGLDKGQLESAYRQWAK